MLDKWKEERKEGRKKTGISTSYQKDHSQVVSRWKSWFLVCYHYAACPEIGENTYLERDRGVRC